MTIRDEIRFECAFKESDARVVMEWRNDPETLKWSFHQQPKSWPTFWEKFQSDYFCFSDLPPLFAWIGEERVAFIRFRPHLDIQGRKQKTCDISIVVAPEQRGKGIGTAVLEAAGEWAALQGYQQILAKIKVDNKASQKAFEAAGYKRVGQYDELIFDTDEVIPVYYYLYKTSHIPRASSPVYIIAEAGSNWVIGSDQETNRKNAFALIDAAAEVGANAIKFQVFRGKTIYAPGAGSADYLSEAGMKEEIHEIFSGLEVPYEWIPEWADHASKVGIDFMASPFSPADFDAVDPYVEIHKIASYEIGYMPLLELVAKTKKPIFMSTGAANEDEIAWAVDFLKSRESGPLTLLQCTAKYPAPPEEMDLRVLCWLRQRFQVPVGLSDHSSDPIAAPAAAVALGAVVIEKHFTLDRNAVGPDHRFAVTPSELRQLIQVVREIEKMRGEKVKSILPSETELHAFACRGIQALQAIAEGDILQEGVNIGVLRPGKQSKGVHSRYLPEIEGQQAKRSLMPGEGLQKGDW